MITVILAHWQDVCVKSFLLESWHFHYHLALDQETEPSLFSTGWFPGTNLSVIYRTVSITILIQLNENIYFLNFRFFFTELYYDRGNHHEFTSLVKELARPGEMSQNQSFGFEFQQVEKPYESYTGANVRLR